MRQVMKGKSIEKNYLLNLLYQILVLLVPVITTPYVSRVLGAEGIGKYSYSYSIVSFFTIFAVLGTGNYAQREVAYCRDNVRELSALFEEIFILRLFSTIICSAIYAFYVCVAEDRKIAILQSAYLIAVAVDVTWFFQGLEEFKEIVTRNILIKIVNIFAVFLLVKDKNDLNIYIGILSILPLLGNFLVWGYLKKYIIWIPLAELKISRHIKGVIQLFIPTIAIQIYTAMDKTMIGLFTTSSVENGYYEQAERLVRICQTFVTSLGTVMTPRIAYIYAHNDKKSMLEYMRNSYRFVWFSGIPICFGLMSTIDFVVPWYLGDGFEKVQLLVKILSFLVIIVGFSNITGMQYLMTTQKQNILSITVMIGAAINFSLNCILIPAYYSVGAAIASVIAETCITLMQFFYIVYISKEGKWRLFFSSSIHYLISGFLMMIVLAVLKGYFQTNFQGTVCMVVIGAGIYVLSLVLQKDEFMLKYGRKCIQIVLRK